MFLIMLFDTMSLFCACLSGISCLMCCFTLASVLWPLSTEATPLNLPERNLFWKMWDICEGGPNLVNLVLDTQKAYVSVPKQYIIPYKM